MQRAVTSGRFCEQCGAELAPDVRWCTACGAPVSGADAAAEAPTTVGAPPEPLNDAAAEAPTTIGAPPEPAAGAPVMADAAATTVGRPPEPTPEPATPTPVERRVPRPAPPVPPTPPTPPPAAAQPAPGAPGGRSGRKVALWIAGIVLVLIAGGLAIAHFVHPTVDAVASATDRAVTRAVRSPGGEGGPSYGGYQNRPRGLEAYRVKRDGLAVDTKVLAIKQDDALAEATVTYRARVAPSGAARAIVGRDGVPVTERWRVGLRRRSSNGSWQPAWLYATSSKVDFARPLEASAGDLATAKGIAERAAAAFATFESSDTDETYNRRQLPFYTAAAASSDAIDGDVASAVPTVDAAPPATGALPNVLSQQLYNSNGPDSDSGALDLSSASASDVRLDDPVATSDLEASSPFQHAEVTGEMRISGGDFSSCSDGFDDPPSTTSGTMPVRMELIRSRLAADSLWYVSRFAVTVPAGMGSEVTLPVADSALGQWDRKTYQSFEDWAGASPPDSVEGTCY